MGSVARSAAGRRKRSSGCEPKMYLIHVGENISPELKGPYGTEADRMKAARRLYSRSGGESVEARLNVTCAGKAVISAISGGEMG